MLLDPVQIRVLGALIEKEITTPENYPLSLNALVNACNQKSSRDPVMELAEAEVRTALFDLEALGLARARSGDRVPKYEHRVRDGLQLRRDETALICLLLLRGPQTPGELRTRADRMYAFDDLESVTATLNRLASRTEQPEPDSQQFGNPSQGTGPLIAILPRQPGARESRYTHLLGGMPEIIGPALSPSQRTGAPRPDYGTWDSRMDELQNQLEALTARVAALENKSANTTTEDESN